MRHLNRKLQKQQGFTIVELMIATTVLSVILLLVTLVMTSIGTLYSKGVNQSHAQDAARNIVDDVSQNLELSNGYTTASSGSVNAYCIGNVRYTYILGEQIGKGTTHSLWRDTTPSGGCSTVGVNLNADPASAGGTELVSPLSRLTNFTILGTYPYDISVRVAYGDDDLLYNANVSTDFSETNAAVHHSNLLAASSDVRCKGGAGDQFCSTANLSTSVAARIKVQ